MNNPIFIFGSARSGTSLLSRIVNSHPNIGIPFETHLYNRFYPWLKFYGSLELNKNRDRLINDILQTGVMTYWDPKPDYDEIIKLLKIDNFHGIVDALMNAWLKKCGKKRWGEKTPWHMYYWQEIMEGFPDAKFIFIVRDGRDASMSWKKARFGPKHIYSLAKRWKHFHDEYEKFKKVVKPENLYELKYEDLLDTPEKITAEICTFIGEEYSDEMLAFYKTTTSYKTDKGNNKNLTKPLIKSNKDKWKKALSQDEKRIFEAVAGDELERYGYQRVVNNASITVRQEVFINYLLHPALRMSSMIKNLQGHRDGIVQLFVYLRLRIFSLLNN
ncbi:MAG: sulfotransferase [Gammaproteobacteria bacterium]